MSNTFMMPQRLVQAIGLACVPAHDMPPSTGAAGRVPVAAAVLTLRQRDDGHVDIGAARMSDIRPAEFPLPHLIEEALAPGALTIVSPGDRTTLAIDAAHRRYFLQPKLAAIVKNGNTADLMCMPGTRDIDEHALCRRLSIPIDPASDADTERLFHRATAHLVEQRALAQATSRMMLWCHAAAFLAAEPGLFFEPMLALHAWLGELADTAPALSGWLHARPVMRAVSFAGQYRDSLQRRDAGEPAPWTQFRDGLFHT